MRYKVASFDHTAFPKLVPKCAQSSRNVYFECIGFHCQRDSDYNGTRQNKTGFKERELNLTMIANYFFIILWVQIVYFKSNLQHD